MRSRVTTTRVLAEAIAASETKPAFLAGNGIGIYGDHGDQPRHRVGTDSRATPSHPRHAAVAGRDRAGIGPPAPGSCVLRTAPIYRPPQPAAGRRCCLLFKAGLGGIARRRRASTCR